MHITVSRGAKNAKTPRGVNSSKALSSRAEDNGGPKMHVRATTSKYITLVLGGVLVRED